MSVCNVVIILEMSHDYCGSLKTQIACNYPNTKKPSINIYY